MFCGHEIKSIQHCSIVHQGFGRTYWKIVSFFTCVGPGDIDRWQRSIKGKRHRLLVPGLTVSKSHELLVVNSEPLQAWSLLPRLRDEAGINGNRNAILWQGVHKMFVERHPVKRLLEVLAEPALTWASAPRHLGEVHASWRCKKKFHGLYDECTKRFA